MTRIAAFALAVVFASCHRDDDPAPPSAAPPPASDRAAPWRDDLHVLATQLAQHHANLFFHISQPAWQRAVDDLDRAIPQLDDAHVVVELARLVATIGDGHTKIGVFGHHGFYPLAFVWFDDGIFAVGADGDARWAIGRKLVAIGAHPIADVIATMSPLIARDNDAGIHAELPVLLLDPALLAGTGLAAADRATFQLAAADGSVRALELRAGDHGAPIAPPTPLPVHLQGPPTNYWNRWLEPERTIYFAYNACANDPVAPPFAEFAASTFAFADQHHVDRFVIDLRRNQGGDSRILQPLLDGLAARPALAAHVFAIIGMHTFSSGMMAAMDLKRRVHATLVGGPTGGKPNAYGEIKTFTLPHSKFLVQYSTKLFAQPDFPADAVLPDLPITVTSADWFAGRDPALAAILGP